MELKYHGKRTQIDRWIELVTKPVSLILLIENEVMRNHGVCTMEEAIDLWKGVYRQRQLRSWLELLNRQQCTMMWCLSRWCVWFQSQSALPWWASQMKMEWLYCIVLLNRAIQIQSKAFLLCILNRSAWGHNAVQYWSIDLCLATSKPYIRQKQLACCARKQPNNLKTLNGSQPIQFEVVKPRNDFFFFFWIQTFCCPMRSSAQ